MSYRIISQTTDGHKEVVADTKADLDDIELAPMGSCALVLEDKNVYVLDGDGKWVAV